MKSPTPFVFTMLLSLSACGSDGASQQPESVSVVPAPVTPTPTPTSTPTPEPTGDAVSDPAQGTLGSKTGALDAIPQYTYPAMATASIGDVTYPTGAKQVDIPVSLDHATPNTVFVRVKTANGSGDNYVYSGAYYQTVDTYVIFRPGDPLVKTVSVPIVKTKENGWFKLTFPEVPQGANVGKNSATITSIKGASPTRAITTGFRAPRTFKNTGKLVYNMDVASVRWSDKGGPGVFSTSFTHGRTQPGNAETGLYLDSVLQPTAEAPFALKDGKLILHSQLLTSALSYGGTSYSYGAAVLNGRSMPETQITYGQYEWEATMPDRRGSWPALWLIGVRGWPPEIDVYEGFGQNSSFDFDRDISANIHGGPINQRKFTRSMWIDGTSAYGISHVASATHKYAVDIQPDYITWFIDGQETYQARNPFSEAFYPVMNVAVKTNGAYTGGSADMAISSFKVWKN